MILISSSECANSLSLAGLIPISFKNIAATKSNVRITGKNISQKKYNGLATKSTACSALAIATDFGTSSPKTTCKRVMKLKAITKDTVCKVVVLSISNIIFNGSLMISATAGSPIQPSARELSVMPSCVALR